MAPYPGMTNAQVMEHVLKGGFHSQPAQCHDSVYAVMKLCWQANAAKRPTFRKLIDDFSHIWTAFETNGGFSFPNYALKEIEETQENANDSEIAVASYEYQ